MNSNEDCLIGERAAEFLRSLAADLVRRSTVDEGLLPFAERLTNVDCSFASRECTEQFKHPSMSLLDPALEIASGDPDVLMAARRIAQGLHWYQIYPDGEADTALAEGLLAAQIVGNVGLFASSQIRCGLFLIAPGIHYPLHTHRASEAYYCLSGELEISHGIKTPSFWLGPGGHSITPSNRLHSLTTHRDPALLVYIWIGDVNSPNWWWERQADGGWLRTQWVRRPDGPWVRTVTEPVTAKVMHEATRS